jgi:hypothetical protein
MQNKIIIITLLIRAVLPAGAMAADGPVACTPAGTRSGPYAIIPDQYTTITDLQVRFRNLVTHAPRYVNGNCTVGEMLNTNNISPDQIPDQYGDVTAKELRGRIREQIRTNASEWITGNFKVGKLLNVCSISSYQVPDQYRT